MRGRSAIFMKFIFKYGELTLILSVITRRITFVDSLQCELDLYPLKPVLKCAITYFYTCALMKLMYHIYFSQNTKNIFKLDASNNLTLFTL